MDCVDRCEKKRVARRQMPIICGCASSAAIVALTLMVGLTGALPFIPVTFAVCVLAYLLSREKRTGPRDEAIMNEAPTAIGMMRLMIDGGRSLDSAVREVASNGPAGISRMFAKAVWDVDSRTSSNIRDSVSMMLSSLPHSLAPFRRSVYLLMSASDSKDGSERMRITKDANDTILAGLRELGESYSSKLNAPCMIIFGIGVMVPMILVSILPMLSIGGQFSSSTIDPMMIAVITLIVIPAAVAGVIMMISSGNPFYVRSGEMITMIRIVPAAVCVPVFIVMLNITADITLSAAVSAIVSGSSLFVSLDPAMRMRRRITRTETIMGDALFDLGNRLLSGDNFEAALTASFKGRSDCAELASSLERCIMISRGDTADAIRRAMGPYSARMASLYCDVHSSSLKDLRDAGRLAVSMGHQLQDQTATVNGIQNKLRSMLDMMTGTSSVFAPLILGISVSMLAPLMDLAGGAETAFTSPVLMIYLIELAVLISVLTTQLRCRGGILTTMHTFSMMMPVSLMIFGLSTYTYISNISTPVAIINITSDKNM
ncbi:MAG: hypothetical protein LBV13_00805 [Methanomassiliicoccaceae archaeon]|jgi:Flp pilus assembly protein TadB|nr:hypothetical protein [Methanomassiliicoccaceae archaeon]